MRARASARGWQRPPSRLRKGDESARDFQLARPIARQRLLRHPKTDATRRPMRPAARPFGRANRCRPTNGRPAAPLACHRVRKRACAAAARLLRSTSQVHAAALQDFVASFAGRATGRVRRELGLARRSQVGYRTLHLAKVNVATCQSVNERLFDTGCNAATESPDSSRARENPELPPHRVMRQV